MKNLIFTLLAFSLISIKLQAQIGINEDNSQPDASAILDVKSSTKGVLITRMTSTDRGNITSPATGLLVYDTTTKSFWFYNGGWKEISLSTLHDADNDTKVRAEEDFIGIDIAGSERLVIKQNANGHTLISLPNNNRNTFFGEKAGQANSGGQNTFFGEEAGQTNTTGSANTFLGEAAGQLNTTGGQNTFNGKRAGYRNMTGLNNSFFGAHAGGANTTGNYNTFIGTGAGLSNTEGEKNTFIGEETGVSNSIGNNNTYNGFLAGYSNTTGNENTFYGSKAGYSNGTGEGNVSLGYKAGYNETGSNKLYIENSDTSTPLIYGEFDNDRIGINRVATTNTLEVGGDASKASAGDWLANSDARLKKNIKQLSSEKVLNQILQLQGVTYEWNDDKTGNIRPEGIQYGFTAQNIKEVFPTLVNEDNTGYLQTAYGTYDAMTVEAIRALNDKIDNQSAEISKLKKENEVLKNQAAKINQLETMMAELQSQIQGNNIADNSEN